MIPPVCWKGHCFEFKLREDGRNIYRCGSDQLSDFTDGWSAMVRGCFGLGATAAEALDAASEAVRRRVATDMSFLEEID